MRKLTYLAAAAALGVVLVQSPAGAQAANEMQLLSRIAQQPNDVANYLELVKVYRANRRFDEAEQMLLRALELLREERRTGQPVNASPTVMQPEPAARPDTMRQAGAAFPLRVGGDIKEPKKIRDVKPIYPEMARAARVSGIVIIEATIDRNGLVRDAQVLRSVPLLDQAALNAVYQWQFQPTLLNGSPVEVIMTVTVSFQADGTER